RLGAGRDRKSTRLRARSRRDRCRGDDLSTAEPTARMATDAMSSVSTMPSAPPAFHLLAKPTGAVCNLDCSYCFFLSKEMLYPGSRFRMAGELLDAYNRQLIH